MKALVFNGPKDIRYETYDDPELETKNSVILKVNKCSICGSDLHIYHGDSIGGFDYQQGGEKFCVGHEFLGEIVETGPEVHRYRVGDRVLSAGGTGCGKCVHCRAGQPHKCKNIYAFGNSPQLNGGQAEFVCVPNADLTLARIDDIADEQAMLMTDAMATAYFGIKRAAITPGGTVAVVGLGPIGILGVELAFIAGAAKVYAIDPVAARRDMATSLGAIALAPGKEGVGLIREETEGEGVDSVFEASGATAAIDSVLKLVRREGTVSFVGLPQRRDSLSMYLLMYKNITARAGIANVTDTWPSLFPLIRSGRLKAANLFTHNFKLSDGADAYSLFDSRDQGVVKIMMDVD